MALCDHNRGRRLTSSRRPRYHYMETKLCIFTVSGNPTSPTSPTPPETNFVVFENMNCVHIQRKFQREFVENSLHMNFKIAFIFKIHSLKIRCVHIQRKFLRSAKPISLSGSNLIHKTAFIFSFTLFVF